MTLAYWVDRARWASAYGYPAKEAYARRKIKQIHAIAAAAREGGDVEQAPGNAPQSGGTAASPDPRRIA